MAIVAKDALITKFTISSRDKTKALKKLIRIDTIIRTLNKSKNILANTPVVTNLTYKTITLAFYHFK